MKRVLVPVDFSTTSVNALLYGIEMANHLKAHLRVIHVSTGIHYAPAFAKNQIESQLMGQTSQWMEELITEYKPKYTVPQGRFDYKMREGNVVKEISNQAKYDDSALIVVGAHGASGFEDRFVGSNAYRLVASCPCPVIVVNNAMEWQGNIRKILVPMDFSKASREKIPVVAGLAKLFGAKVYLAGIKESNLKFIIKRIGLFNKQVEKYLLENAGIEVETVMLGGKDPAEKVIEFAKEINADLVSIHIHHSSNPFANLFRPFNNDLINKSTKPVLAIPTKD